MRASDAMDTGAKDRAILNVPQTAALETVPYPDVVFLRRCVSPTEYAASPYIDRIGR